MYKLKTFFFLFRSISENRFGNSLTPFGGRDRFGIRLHLASDTWQCETHTQRTVSDAVETHFSPSICFIFEVGQLVQHFASQKREENEKKKLIFTMCHKVNSCEFSMSFGIFKRSNDFTLKALNFLSWFRGGLWRFRSIMKERIYFSTRREIKKKNETRNKYMQNCVIIFFGGKRRTDRHKCEWIYWFIIQDKNLWNSSWHFVGVPRIPHAVTQKLFHHRRRVDIIHRESIAHWRPRRPQRRRRRFKKQINKSFQI